MLRTFNCGLGMVVVIIAADAERVMHGLRRAPARRCARSASRAPRRRGEAESIVESRSLWRSEGRRPDLRPRHQHGGADPGRLGADFPARIVLVTNVEDALGPADGARRRHRHGVISHKDYPDREAFDAASSPSCDKPASSWSRWRASCAS